MNQDFSSEILSNYISGDLTEVSDPDDEGVNDIL